MGIISVMSIMDSSGLHFPRSTEHMYGNPLFLPRIKMFRFERMENKETTAQALQDSYPNLFSDNQLYALLRYAPQRSRLNIISLHAGSHGE